MAQAVLDISDVLRIHCTAAGPWTHGGDSMQWLIGASKAPHCPGTRLIQALEQAEQSLEVNMLHLCYVRQLN
jgi:hypothetical protein